MPSGPNTTPSASPASEARLRLTTAATGRFDGAWWPHARDLSAELPTLLGAVTERLGRIDRVTYHLEEWPAPHRRLAFDEGVVRLEGFRSQAAGSLTVIGWNRKRLTLAVVPPETGPETAERVLADAASGRTPQPA